MKTDIINITSEIYDLRSRSKVYPIAFFPDYVISKNGLIINTITMNEVKPVSYSKKEGWIHELVNSNGLPENRSTARLMCDTFYGRSEYPIKFLGSKKQFDFDEIYLSTGGLDIIEYDNYIIIGNDRFNQIRDTDIYINENGVCFNNSNRYNVYKDKFLKLTIKKGYYHLPILRVKYGLSDRIHRASYEAWVGIIPDDYTIDHVDGFKWNNSYKNLEAVTSEENTYRFNIHQYIPDGYTIEEFIKEISDEIMSGKSYKDIAELFDVPHRWVAKIATKKSYSKYTSDYDFSTKGGYLPIDTAKKVISLIEEGESNRNIASILNIDIDRVKKIRKGSCYTNLERKYEPSKYWLLSKSEIKDIKHNLIPSGMSIADIARKYDVSWCTIRDLRDGKTYSDD